MSPLPSVLRALASALLLLHPPDFRREWRTEYRRAVAHRWRLEVERGRRGAWIRVTLVLVTDALRSLPREWWDALAGGPDRHRTPGSMADAPRRPGSGVGVAGWLDGWLRDLRVAARSLGRRPGTSIDPGFAADEVAILTVRAPERRYPTEAERSALYDRVAESLEGMPHVRSSAVSWVIPLSYSIREGEAYLDGEEAPDGEGVFLSTGGIAPGFLETLGIPLLEGRDFTPQERAAPGESGVIIVNRAFAERYPGSVVGRELRFTSAGPEEEPRRIVGVVGNVRSHSLTDEPGRVQVYYPEPGGGDGWSTQRFLVRAAGEPSALIPLVRGRIAALDPQVAVTRARTGREMIRAATEDERFLALLLAVFATLSLLLAVGGVYGAVSLHVSRRTRELGIRVALGAGTERLVREVVTRGLRPVALGILCGAGGALLLVRYARGVLYETSAADPVAFVGASLLLITAAVAASLLPARRVTRVAPVEALRAE